VSNIYNSIIKILHKHFLIRNLQTIAHQSPAIIMLIILKSPPFFYPSTFFPKWQEVAFLHHHILLDFLFLLFVEIDSQFQHLIVVLLCFVGGDFLCTILLAPDYFSYTMLLEIDVHFKHPIVVFLYFVGWRLMHNRSTRLLYYLSTHLLFFLDLCCVEIDAQIPAPNCCSS